MDIGQPAILSEAGADNITCFETIGWRGVMEKEEGCSLPDRFPSLPGAVFPLYHVLADVGEFWTGQAFPVKSSIPLSIIALALSKRSHAYSEEPGGRLCWQRTLQCSPDSPAETPEGLE